MMILAVGLRMMMWVVDISDLGKWANLFSMTITHYQKLTETAELDLNLTRMKLDLIN